MGKVLDWVGTELLSKLCFGHIAWGMALGLLFGSLIEDRNDARICGVFLVVVGMAGMIGHYIYRRKEPPDV